MFPFGYLLQLHGAGFYRVGTHTRGLIQLAGHSDQDHLKGYAKGNGYANDKDVSITDISVSYGLKRKSILGNLFVLRKINSQRML